jgi:hypothetical protein
MDTIGEYEYKNPTFSEFYDFQLIWLSQVIKKVKKKKIISIIEGNFLLGTTKVQLFTESVS